MKTHTFTHTVTRKGLDGLRCLKAVFLMECKVYACTRTYMNALALTYTRALYLFLSIMLDRIRILGKRWM